MKIGLVGKAGVGKDTAAKMLSERVGLPVIPFAKPLHDAAIHIWGKDCLNRDQKEQEQIFGFHAFEWFYTHHIKFVSENVTITESNLAKLNEIRNVFSEGGQIMQTISPRRFMQIYGTEFWRNVDEHFFVNLLRDKSCIIPDVRFENEAAICDYVIVINRDVPDVANHASEQFARKFTNMAEGVYENIIVIDNNGTLSDLQEKINKLNF